METQNMHGDPQGEMRRGEVKQALGLQPRQSGGPGLSDPRVGNTQLITCSANQSKLITNVCSWWHENKRILLNLITAVRTENM